MTLEERNPFDDIGGDLAPATSRPAAPAAPAAPAVPAAPVAAAEAVPAAEANPFDAIGPAELAPRTSAFESGLHEAERGILPTIAGAGAFGPGAAGGAAIGALGGPFAPITVPAGALVGGLLSSTGAAYVTTKGQDYAVSKLPESWQEATGQDEATREAEARQHPDAVMLGGFLPMALMARPGGFARGTLPENSTALQRLMANPVTARMFGGTLMGGMELGQEKAEGNPVDWRRVATATAFGTVFNKPTRLGEAVETWGGRLGGGATPESSPVVAAAAGATDAAVGGQPAPTIGTPPAEPGMLRFFHGSRGGEDPASGGARWVAPKAEYARDFRSNGVPKTVHYFDATPEEVTPHGGWDETNGYAQNFEAPEHLAGRLKPYTFPPTLAEAGDLKVMGPGITEDVFRGDHVQDPDSAMAAQDAARTEAGVIGPAAPGPDLHDVARRIDPETFGRYDALQEQRDAFRARLAEAANPSDGTLQEAADRRDAVQAQLDKIPATGAGSDKAELRRLRAQVRDAQRVVDALQVRRDAYAEGRAVETPDMAAIRQQLQAVDFEMRDLSPAVASAYRMAADHAAAETVPAVPHPVDPATPGAEPGQFGSMAEMLAARDQQAAAPAAADAPAARPSQAAPPTGRDAPASSEPTAARRAADPLPLTAADMERQRQFIAADVARQLIAAGRPEQEAHASGLLASAYYSTRAARFKGVLGSPEELYRRASPTMVAPDGRRIPGPARPAPAQSEGNRVERPVSEGSNFKPTAAPPAVERPAAEPAPAPAEPESLEQRITRQAIPAEPDHRVVSVDVDKVDALWNWTPDFRIPADAGPGSKLERAKAFIRDLRDGQEFKPPQFGVHDQGLGFDDGRNRFAAMRDLGFKTAPVSMDPASIAYARRLGLIADGGPSSLREAVRADAGANGAIRVRDAVSDLTPAEQRRELPRFSPEAGTAAKASEPGAPAGVFMFSPTALDVDASRFQFKGGGDAYGVTGALRSVTRWDPAKAQALMVWEQADGRLFVADGHQRSGLARRLTEQGKVEGIELPGILYRERDGVTADDMRAIAAVTNIANGSGSALDGAKVLRARPDLMDGSLPLSAGKGQQAAALAKLGDEAFRMVVNDVVPEHYGAVVGQVIPRDPARQVAAMKAIARFEPRSVEEATALTQRVAQAELAKAEEGRQTSMFGDLETPESTAGQEMQIVARAIRDLRRDRTLFARVLANAGRLEEAGTVVERDAAQSVATDAEIFAKVLASDAYTAGPTRTALVAAARDVRDGKASVGEASARILAALRRAAETDGDDRPGTRGGDAGSPAAGEADPIGRAGRAAAGPEVHGLTPGAAWQSLLDARQEVDEARRPDTGFNGQRDRLGRPLRAKAAQQWEPGNVVNSGFVKDLLVTRANDDGSFALVSRPDENGISQSYTSRPQQGLVKGDPVTFMEAARDVLPEPAREMAQSSADEVDPDQGTFFQPRGTPAEVAQDFLDAARHVGARDGDPHGLADIRSAIEAADRGQSSATLFQRRGDRQLSIALPPMGDVPASRGYFTRQRAFQDANHFDRLAAEMEAGGGDATKIAERRAFAAALREALPRFDEVQPSADKAASRDPNTPRGAPFTRSKLIEAGRHAVTVATDERHAFSSDVKTYRIYAKPEGGLDTVKTPSRDLGRELGNVQLEQHPDGRWEVKMVEVKPSARGKGVARDLYAAVQQDLGIKMQPSGVLLPDGYAMWQRRDSNAVKWHQRVEDGEGKHYFLSPRWLAEHRDGWASADPTFDSGMKAAEAALPPEAKTPEALATMFQGSRADRANASITFRPGARPLLKMFGTADASTFIHESGHQFLEEMMQDAAHPAAPDDLRADARTVRDWLGNDGGPLKTAQHERFARGFEQYMREGVAPSPELAGVFARFRDWLTTIYRTLKGLGPEISPDVRAVFDRLLSTDPQRTVVAPDRDRGPSLADVHEGDALAMEPHEAAGGADRADAEAARALAEAHPEHLSEIESARARIAATREAERRQQDAAGGAGAQPVGQAGEVADGRGGLGGDRSGSAALPGSGGAGAPADAERQGSRGDATEGTGLRDRERVGSAAAGDDGAGRPADGEDDAAGIGKPLAPGPATRFEPDRSRFVDRAGNIRLDTLSTSDEVRQAIRDAAAENRDFMGDRGGRVTDGQVMDLAEAAGLPGAMDIVMKRVQGQAFNAVEVMTLRKALVQSAQGLSDAARAAKDGDPQSLLAFAEVKARHQLLQGTVAAATAEAGRALRAFRDITMSGEAKSADLFAREATGRTLLQLKREADLMATMDTPEKLSKFTADTNRASAGRLLMELYVNGLISGPVTHTTYAIGNTILTANRMLVELPAAAAVGALRRGLGGADGVRAGEIGAQLRGAASGFAPALQSMADAYRTGATTLLPGEGGPAFLPFAGSDFAPAAGLDEHATLFSVIQGIVDGVRAAGGIARASASDLVTGARGGPLVGLQRDPAAGYWPNVAVRGVTVLPVGDVVRFPGRNVAAIHSFFRAMNYSIDKAGIAYRTAANEGLTGEQLAARVADIHANPTDAVMEQARSTATNLTLMGQGGEFVKRLSALLNWTPEVPGIGPVQPLRFIDPFVKISGNVMGQALLERTPLGAALSPEIRASLAGRNGPAAQDLAMGRIIAGTALATTFGLLAKQGLVTGSGPQGKDEQETRHLQAMWKLAGNQAHSVRIGDLWYDVHRLGPLGMLMGVAADLSEIGSYATDGDLGKAGGAVMHAFTQNILDESFVKGPADLIEAVQDPARYGPSYVRNQLAGFVPYSTALAQMARAGDPYSREARSIVDTIKAKIPGLSETLLPKRDVWGMPIPARDALGGPYATAIYAQRANADPIARALLDIGVYPAPVERKIRGVELTDAQHDDFARIAGGLLHDRMRMMVGSRDWPNLPGHVRHDIVEAQVKATRETAAGMVMMKYPSIPAAAVAARRAKATGPQ